MSHGLLGQACHWLCGQPCSRADGLTAIPKRTTSLAASDQQAAVSTDASGDGLRFLKAWCAKPIQIAALAPSGRALAELMTCELHSGMGRILELGPGAGAFTRAILARGVPASELTLIESEAVFAQLLRERFPEASVMQMDAANLLAESHVRQRRFGAVVSGLPLLSMRTRTVMRILAGAFNGLEEGGSLYQFTYGLQCPIPRRMLDRLGLKATRIGGTVANFPPAWVYRISRRAKPRHHGLRTAAALA